MSTDPPADGGGANGQPTPRRRPATIRLQVQSRPGQSIRLSTVPPSREALNNNALGSAASPNQTRAVRVSVGQIRNGTTPPPSSNNAQPPGNATMPLPNEPVTHLNTAGGMRMFYRFSQNHAHNHGQHHVFVDLLPLTPKPLPDGAHALADEEKYGRFVCVICSEFMDQPVSCGKCTSRFCHKCLLRVASGTDNTAARRPEPEESKCPTCRLAFKADDIVRDQELHAEMRDLIVPCRFPTCASEILLPDVAEHERTCPHQPCSCRYASFGCKWQGPRGTFAQHEMEECHVAKVSGFVNQFREQAREHTGKIELLNQQVAGVMRTQALQKDNLQRDQYKSPSDILDVLVFCQKLTWGLPMVFFVRDKYIYFLRTPEARASVVNAVTFIPTALICAKTSIRGFVSFFHFIDCLENDETSAREQLLLENVFTALFAFFCGVSIVSCIFLDPKSSVNFYQVHMPWPIGGTPRLLKGAIEILTFCIHSLSFYYGGTSSLRWVKDTIQWLLVAFASAFFPSLILTLSNGVNYIPSASTPLNPQRLCRCVAPIMFGLRYSLLYLHFDPISCMDALCFMLVLKPHAERLSKDLFTDECLLNCLTPTVRTAYAVCRVAVAALHFQGWDMQKPFEVVYLVDGMWNILDSLLAFVVLFLINVVFNLLFRIGNIIGRKMIETSRNIHMIPEGIEKHDNELGFVCFALWTLSLVGIVVIP